MRESTATLIAARVNSLRDDQIFSARQMLKYGTSGAVYNQLSRMVKREEIIRIARGLYVRSTPHFVMPNAQAIVAAKSQAFEKQFYMQAQDAAFLLDLVARGNNGLVVSTDGCTSDFASSKGRITLKQTAPRKVKLGDDIFGVVLRALWHLKKGNFSEAVLRKVTDSFSTTQRVQFRHLVGLMPWWIGNVVVRSGLFPLTS